MSASTQVQLRQGDVLAKKYEVDSVLGAGPQGGTYLARSLTSSKKYAIKMLVGPPAPEAVAQAFLQQVAELQSDGLVRCVDTGEHLGQRYLVYEYSEGESLRRLLDEYAGKKQAFTLQEACQIVVKTLDAVSVAHAKGQVHRHLRPSNVIVHSRAVGPGAGKTVRTVRVTGLGTAELVHSGLLQEAVNDQTIAAYMAPELSSANQGGGPQADIYSAGIMFYELLCGQTPMGTYLAPTQIRDDLPKHVDDIVDLALASNAEDRYPTARDMINDIQRTFTDEDKPIVGLSKRMLAVVIGGSIAVIALAATVLLVTDPAAANKRKDDQARAEIAKANPVPDAELIKQKLAARPDMVFIPTGTYLAGRLNIEEPRDASAKEPLAKPAKVEAYYIDRFEWGNVKGGNPLVNVTHEKAAELCASAGKRLCSADEWERACKGPENHIYSYGDTFNTEICGPDVAPDANRDERSDWLSGQMTACESGFHVYDLSGGPKEWTDTKGASSAIFRVVRGGLQADAKKGSRCGFSEERSAKRPDRGTSFRCCISDAADTQATGAGGGPAGAVPVEGAPLEGAAPGGAPPVPGATPVPGAAAGAAPAAGTAPTPG